MVGDYGTPVPPLEEETEKKSNTSLIIAIVVVVLLCCCCFIMIPLFYFVLGDMLMEALGLTWMPYLLFA